MAAFEFNPKLNAAFQNKLTRDDETDPNGRIYRNEHGEIFHCGHDMVRVAGIE